MLTQITLQKTHAPKIMAEEMNNDLFDQNMIINFHRIIEIAKRL